jgi:hypothetical protein
MWFARMWRGEKLSGGGGTVTGHLWFLCTMEIKDKTRTQDKILGVRVEGKELGK